MAEDAAITSGPKPSNISLPRLGGSGKRLLLSYRVKRGQIPRHILGLLSNKQPALQME